MKRFGTALVLPLLLSATACGGPSAASSRAGDPTTAASSSAATPTTFSSSVGGIDASITVNPDLVVLVEEGAHPQLVAAAAGRAREYAAAGSRVQARLLDGQNADVFTTVVLDGLEDGKLSATSYPNKTLREARAAALEETWTNQLLEATKRSGENTPADLLGAVENSVATGAAEIVLVTANGGISSDSGATHDFTAEIIAPALPPGANQTFITVLGVGQVRTDEGTVDPTFTNALIRTWEEFVGQFARGSAVVR